MRSQSLPRFVLLLAVVSAVCVAASFAPSVVNTIVRLELAAGTLGLLVSAALFSAARGRRFLWRTLAVLVVVVLPLLLPARAEPTALRQAFVDAMKRYVDVPYVWGGERGHGLDCSGLVRKSWRDALVERAFLDVDPGLLRRALASWFWDKTAGDLKDGAGTFAVRRGTTIDAMALADRRAGDLVTTTDGTHVLAFVDQGRVIEADPHILRVVLLPTDADNRWFKTPVDIVSFDALR